MKLIFFLLFPFFVYSQNKVKFLDSETKKPIENLSIIPNDESIIFQWTTDKKGVINFMHSLNKKLAFFSSEYSDIVNFKKNQKKYFVRRKENPLKPITVFIEQKEKNKIPDSIKVFGKASPSIFIKKINNSNVKQLASISLGIQPMTKTTFIKLYIFEEDSTKNIDFTNCTFEIHAYLNSKIESPSKEYSLVSIPLEEYKIIKNKNYFIAFEIVGSLTNAYPIKNSKGKKIIKINGREEIYNFEEDVRFLSPNIFFKKENKNDTKEFFNGQLKNVLGSILLDVEYVIPN